MDKGQSGQLEFRDDHLLDTLIYPSTLSEDCLAQLTALAYQPEVSWGYYFGPNAFGSVAKAQRFELDNDSYKVTGAIVAFGDISLADTGTVFLSVLEVNEDGSPGAVITNSDTLGVDELANNMVGDTAIFGTQFTFYGHFFYT